MRPHNRPTWIQKEQTNKTIPEKVIYDDVLRSSEDPQTISEYLSFLRLVRIPGGRDLTTLSLAAFRQTRGAWLVWLVADLNSWCCRGNLLTTHDLLNRRFGCWWFTSGRSLPVISLVRIFHDSFTINPDLPTATTNPRSFGSVPRSAWSSCGASGGSSGLCCSSTTLSTGPRGAKLESEDGGCRMSRMSRMS